MTDADIHVSLREDARTAASRVVSQAPSVDAAQAVGSAGGAGGSAGATAPGALAAVTGPAGLVAVGLGGAVVEAAQAQAHAAELEEMVTSTLFLATEVDQDLSTGLAAAGGTTQAVATSGGGVGVRGTEPRWAGWAPRYPAHTRRCPG